MSGRLGIALLVIATAQLMLVLDDSIANVALPTIQNELNISPATLPWVINAYILAFGSLLLFGGRAGDLFGRRRVFQGGILLFTTASLLVGLAPTGGLLIAARALQGIGAAITAPNALALIATTFPQGKPRNNAVAVYGAMSALGIVLGLLLGGILTGFLGWRWVFFINVPIGLAVLAGTRTLVGADRHTGRLDITGVIIGTGGMAALVYGITYGGEHGWTDGLTLGLFAAAAVLLPLFLVIQARSADPLLPLRLFQDRNRAGSYLSMLLLGAGPMGTFYLVTLYMQHILRYSPIQTGLAWLPFAVGLVLAAGAGSKLVARFAPRALLIAGVLIASGGVFWLSTVGVEADYVGHIVPGIFAVGFGFGMSAVTLTLTAVYGVKPEDSGIASALLNAAQQLGVALGLALLSTVSVTVTAARLPDALTALYRGREVGDTSLVTAASTALVEGYASALLVAAGVILAAAPVVIVAITTRRTQRADETGAETDLAIL
ncbi:MAG: MFS transporter [Chloroflexota bacterium]|nr:MFS transporter [Chloroflexota bacterium]